MKLGYLLFGMMASGNCLAACPAPKICVDLNKQYNISSAKPDDEVAFFRLLALAKKSLPKECKVRGIPGKMAGYRACFRHPLKKGNFSEDVVMSWFSYMEESDLPEGPAFISGEKFRETLEGAWIDKFLGDE